MMVDDLKKVYEKLNDHISKKLFMARLEYFVSGTQNVSPCLIMNIEA